MVLRRSRGYSSSTGGPESSHHYTRSRATFDRSRPECRRFVFRLWSRSRPSPRPEGRGSPTPTTCSYPSWAKWDRASTARNRTVVRDTSSVFRPEFRQDASPETTGLVGEIPFGGGVGSGGSGMGNGSYSVRTTDMYEVNFRGPRRTSVAGSRTANWRSFRQYHYRSFTDVRDSSTMCHPGLGYSYSHAGL